MFGNDAFSASCGSMQSEIKMTVHQGIRLHTLSNRVLEDSCLLLFAR